MSYSMTDPSGGYFDPTTGMYVPASNMPTKQQATAPNGFSGAGNALSAIGNALAPALMQGANGAPPMPTPPAGLQSQPGAYTDPTSGLNAPPGMLNRTPGQPGVYTDPTTGQTAPPGMLNKPPVQAALGPQGPQADPYASAPSPASQPGMAAAIAAAQANQQPTAGAAAAATPPPSGEAPGGATGAPGSDYYSNAQGPQDPAQQKIVQDAADKYGVPLNVANWVGYHESGWNPNATGISTSSGKAQGAWQFMPGTAKQYGVDNPNDFAQSTDGAMHYLSDLAKKNGGDWTQAVQQYGTFSTGMGADRDAAAKNGFMAYLGQKPGAAPGPTLAATTAEPVQQPGQSGPGGYDPATDPAIARMKAMFQMSGVTPVTQSDKLLALASGLLSGPNFSQGAGKGLAAMGQVTQQQRAQALQMAQMGIESQYHDALMGLSGQRLGIQQQNANTGAGRLVNQQNVTQNRFSPQTQAALKQSGEAGENAEKDINATMASQQADEQAMKDTQQAQTLIQQNPTMMGPTLMNRATRTLAEMGIAGDPNTLNAIQKMTADQRNTYLSSLTGGHVGGIKSNQELKNLSQAVADVNTSPQAAQWIIQMQQSQIGARQAWRQELQTRSQTPEGMDSITGRQYNMTKNQFFNDYDKAHPLPDYQGSQAAPAAPAPGSTPQGGTKGVTTIHYDAQGNPVQ